MLLSILNKGYQKTISKPITIKGYASFSATPVSMTVRPNLKGGIFFRCKKGVIQVCPENIKMHNAVHTSIIKNSHLEIVSVEHLLAAVNGLGIDSLVIELNGGNQIPALDSSSQYFTEKFIETGFRKINQKKFVVKINHRFKFIDPDSDSFAELSSSDGLEINAEIHFNNLIATQRYSSKVTPALFRKNISWGRTFIRSPLNEDPEKWQRIRKLIPILPEDPQKSPILVFSDKGFITKLIKKDEPVRHKILDFLGDLGLLGLRVEGKIRLYKPGHHFNHKLVQFLNSNLTGDERKRFKVT